MNISSTTLGFLEYWGIYRAKRRSGGHPRWAQPTRARLGLLARPGGLLIRLQRIYIFLLFHAIILSILDVHWALLYTFISFLGLTD